MHVSGTCNNINRTNNTRVSSPRRTAVQSVLTKTLQTGTSSFEAAQHDSNRFDSPNINPHAISHPRQPSRSAQAVVLREKLLSMLNEKKDEVLDDCEKMINERMHNHMQKYLVARLAIKPILLVKPKFVRHALEKRLFKPGGSLLADYFSQWHCENQALNPPISLQAFFENNIDAFVDSVRAILKDTAKKSPVPGVDMLFKRQWVQEGIGNEIREGIPFIVQLISKHGESTGLPFG